MRILTTSDLDYVSGGDSWGGTPEGQAPTSYPSNTGCWSGASYSEYQVAAAVVGVAAAIGGTWYGAVATGYLSYCGID